MLFPLQAQRSPVSGWMLASSTTANMARNRGFELQATKVLARSWVLSSFRSDDWQKGGRRSGPGESDSGTWFGGRGSSGMGGRNPDCAGSPFLSHRTRPFTSAVLESLFCTLRVLPRQLFSNFPHSQKYLFKQDPIENPNILPRVTKKVKPR